jgi:hypothetical protein
MVKKNNNVDVVKGTFANPFVAVAVFEDSVECDADGVGHIKDVFNPISSNSGENICSILSDSYGDACIIVGGRVVLEDACSSFEFGHCNFLCMDLG